jgi:hypothetical protein
VLTHPLQDGVHAHREARCDPRKLHRAGQEGAPAALPIGTVIATAAITAGEPQGLVGATAIDELGGQHAPGAFVPGHGFAIGRQRLVDEAEGVALAQFAVEINVGREDLCQLNGHAVRQAGFVGRGEQGAADAAAGQADLRPKGHRVHLGRPLPALLA